jgi:molybdate transport system substrate-binding protein
VKARLLPFASTLLLGLAACSGGAASPSPSSVPSVAPATAAPTTAASTAPASPSAAPAIDLTIYGAASLKGALAAATPIYEAANPGVTLTVSTDASSALATQIEQGAPADVLLSADAKNPQALVDKGLATGPPVTFASNKLTVIAPADNRAGIKTPADLARPGVKVIAAGDEVPITKYADQLVANLAKEPGYPAGFEAAYQVNIVSKEDNVKAVVAKVELGEGDAGIVYVTDAKASKNVATVDVPAAANVTATYDGVTVKASPNIDAATAFLAWFAGPAGQAILGGFGFLPPS